MCSPSCPPSICGLFRGEQTYRLLELENQIAVLLFLGFAAEEGEVLAAEVPGEAFLTQDTGDHLGFLFL